MRPWLISSAALLAGCAAPAASALPQVPAAQAVARAGGEQGSADARAVLLRLTRAAEGGRWQEAWPLLSARWRAATSPGRLAADWRGAGPVAREAAERVAALLEAGAALVGEGERRTLPVGPGRSARLVLEPGGWRVDALE